MTHFCALRAKTYSYLDYDGKEEKKANGTKKCVIKKNNIDDYRACLFNNNPVLRSQEVFKSALHDLCTLKLNEIALSSNDNKRLQTYDEIATYPYRSSVGKVCKTESLNKVKQID